MSKITNITKKSTITNLIVMPLIASAVFLASPAIASNPMRPGHSHAEVRNITNKESMPNTRKGIAGTVVSVNGNIVVVIAKNNTEYTVDASSATIMKAAGEDANPSIAHVTDIKVGDSIMVRGVIRETD